MDYERSLNADIWFLDVIGSMQVMIFIWLIIAIQLGGFFCKLWVPCVWMTLKFLQVKYVRETSIWFFFFRLRSWRLVEQGSPLPLLFSHFYWQIRGLIKVAFHGWCCLNKCFFFLLYFLLVVCWKYTSCRSAVHSFHI